jgi:DNA-binding response OmpR family regulator
MNSKIKVLIVEDEIIVALELRIELEKLNFEVTDIVCTQTKVMSSIKYNEPAIIVMDINLGKNDNGIDIAQIIRKEKKIPILYLTAFSDDATMERAFSTDPIGYIIKPFKTEELKINIQLALYKIKQNKTLNINENYINENYIKLGGDFYFDVLNRNLYYVDNYINLGAKEKHFLFILVNAENCIVPFSIIEDAIWPAHKVSPSALRTLVYRLKGKLGNNIIQTTYGYGYNLKAVS